MQDFPCHFPRPGAHLRFLERASDFLRWLRTDGDRLIVAAELLGGDHWRARAARVVRAAREGHDIAARQPELRALRDLLYLEHIDGRDTAEARRFLALDPGDLRCAEARICAEALGVGVRALEALRLAGIKTFREVA